MSTELIINATLPETRIALLEDGEIQELHIERDSERGIVGNIYKGKVIRVLPGMQAAFVDIGLEKAAFLYVDDIFFPDMKTPLATNPLPEAQPQQAAPGAARPERGERGRGGRGRFGGRDAGRGAPAPTTPLPPGSPEDHARLQQEYARQMLETDVEGELEPVGAAPEGVPEGTVEAAPSPIAAGASPDDLAVEQPEARSPVAEPLDDEEDEGDAPVVYRAEPLIDADAWVEDIAEADEGDDTEEADASPAGEAAAEAQATPAEATGEALEAAPAEENTEAAPSVEATGEETVAPASAQPLVTPLAEPIAEQNTRRGRGRGGRNKEAGESEDDDSEMPRRRRRREAVNISDLVKEGQEILVQVAKDPIGTKGARLTCHVSLPGRYLVFMPTVDHVGVSRRIEGEGDRRRLKETIGKIRPAKTGVIVRTASGKQTDKKLKADLDYLVTTWNDIQRKYNKQRTPSAVYQDLTIVLRAIRDMFTDEVDTVVVDSKREHKAIMKFVTRFIPNVKDKVELYAGESPIFDYYGIETEIARSLERKVWLKSGGYLVVDQAEALVAIDVNTGRYVGKKTLEETILKTNLEAVKEIAYQLRLRNCGGIIILDLIDMEKEANKDKVYKALEEALKKDRARPTIMKISQLGLIEMTRKRTRDSLVRSLCEPCSYCEGKSFVKNKQTIAYDIMRDIEREGIEKDTQAISIQCHPTVADVILEDKRDVLEDLEHQFNKKITIRGNGAYHVEQYELVAHREGKNMVWSSEERRQLVRQKAQERAQQLARVQREAADAERQERRREQEERRKQQEAERAERRKQAEAAREERRRELEAKRAEAAAKRQALIDSGVDPATLPPEEFEVPGDESLDDSGDDMAAGEGGQGGEGAGDPNRAGRRRRRRGRRGRGRNRNREGGAQQNAQGQQGQQQGHRQGGGQHQHPRPQRPPRLPQPNDQQAGQGGTPGPDAYRDPAPVSGESYSPAELGGSNVSAAEGGLSGEGPQQPGQGGAPGAPGGPRRRRRGRRGGRRHRFRRRPPGGPGVIPNAAGPNEGGGGGGGASESAPSSAPSSGGSSGDEGHDRQ